MFKTFIFEILMFAKNVIQKETNFLFCFYVTNKLPLHAGEPPQDPAGAPDRGDQGCGKDWHTNTHQGTRNLSCCTLAQTHNPPEQMQQKVAAMQSSPVAAS